MKLLVKFNLIFLLVFIAGFAIAAQCMRGLLLDNAQEEVLDRARLMMEKASAVRSYTDTQVAPLLQTQMKYSFLPQSVPAYSATEVLHALHKKYSDYDYKEATLNPTNLRDRAVEWEADIVQHFRGTEGLGEFVGQRDTPTGRSLYVARPIRIDDAGCLQCHSTIDAAPKPMIEKYGASNGFGWNLHEVVGAQIVSVPMSVAVERAQHATRLFLVLLTAVFLGIALALNATLWFLVVRPVRQVARMADQVSTQGAESAEFKSKRRDEIGILIASFERMRRSVVQAMSMIH
jgi:protein-histidine pros-kinase